MDEVILEQAETQAKLYQIFINPRRVLILWALAEREMSVGEIATMINASLQNTSQHLRLMKDRGILSSRRDGQTIYYGIADPTILRRFGISAK